MKEKLKRVDASSMSGDTRIPDAEQRKHAFDLLYASLKRYHEGTIEGAFEVGGFFLLILGWLLTSKDARQFLHTDSATRNLGITAVTVAGLVYAVIAVRIFRHSANVAGQLRTLGYHDEVVYQDRIVRALPLGIFVGAVWLLVVAIIVFLIRLA